MKSLRLISSGATTLAGLTMSLQLAAQEQPAAYHHHYKLIDLGSFGGPRSHVELSYYSDYPFASQDLNDAGTLVGWADTPTPDPYAPNCFVGDCYVAQAFVTRNGILHDLGTLPNGLSSAASWISANGLIAGASQNGQIDPQAPVPAGTPGNPQNRAVLWRDGKIIDLGVLPEPEGGYESGAEAVNSRGQVVGWAINSVPDPYSMAVFSFVFESYEPPEYYQQRAFLWQDGVMRDLGTLGTGTDAYALAINERGQVIGISYTDSTPNQVITQCSSGAPVPAPIPTQDPFLWENGQMIDLGSLGGTCGFPTWISNSGHVVGASDLPGDQVTHAFLWTRTTGIQDLGTLGGALSQANMVNDSGQVTGGSLPPGASFTHAFLWDGTMHDLGAFNGCSWAWAINARGQIVGQAGPGDTGCMNIGFLWEEGAPMVDLNTLVSSGSDFSVIGAFEINDLGEIVGAGMNTNGDQTSILLIPCDDNHPGVEGCDYGLVDARSVAQPAVATRTNDTLPASRSGRALNHRRGVLGLPLPKNY